MQTSFDLVDPATTRSGPQQPNRELRFFMPEEGATEHVDLDRLPHVDAYTAHSIEDRFDEIA
jgi:hypothetical protein